jgi:hypothetical protein
MGISLRLFIVNDDDSLQRIAVAKYERLLDRDPKGRLPQYAGKRMRYALVFVDLKNRRPVEIFRIQYSYLYFDSEGLIEADQIETETKLAYEAYEAIPSLLPNEHSKPVIDARQKFAKRKFDHLYQWAPTPDIEAAIINEIFEKGQKGR